MIDRMFVIREVTKETQEEAKALVLEGLRERFAELNPLYNQDVEDIINAYKKGNHLFFVGCLNKKIICTGAIISEDEGIGRVVRMSVAKEYRRQGYASKMLRKLENRALNIRYKKIVLETTETWDDAISFYKKNGYLEYMRIDNEVQFYKLLEDVQNIS